jgi:phage-related protein
MKDTGSASEDAALMAALFGKENMAAAQILTENTGVMDNYNKTLGGTSTAYEQAAKVMDTTAEKAARLSAKWDVFTEKIGAVLLPILDAAVAGLTSMADALNDIASAVSDFDIGKILDKGKDAVRGFAEYSTLGLSESVLSWVGLGKETDKAANKTKQGAKEMRQATKDVEAVGKAVDETTKKVRGSSRGGGIIAPLAGSVGALRAQLSEAQKQQTDFTVYGSERYNALGLEIEGLTRQIERMGGKFKADQIPIAAMSDEFLAALVPTQQLADELAKISDNIVLIDTVASEADFARRMAEKLEELDEGVMKFVDAGKAIGNVFSAAAFSDEGLKGAMKQTLNMLISFAEAQLLVGTAVATLQTIFGNFGGLVALAGAVALLETARGAVGSFRTGIDYVPRDQMPAFLHRGEAVLREDEAERYRQGKAPKGSGRKDSPVRVQFVAFESAIQDSNVRRSRRMA